MPGSSQPGVLIERSCSSCPKVLFHCPNAQQLTPGNQRFKILCRRNSEPLILSSSWWPCHVRIFSYEFLHERRGLKRLLVPSIPNATVVPAPMMMQGMRKRGKPANIWDVVTSLAKALTDARDQLVGLINFDGTANGNQIWHCNGKENSDNALAMRLRGGGPSHLHVPSNQRVRSVHRQHARGHVAFGNHSEYKPEPPGNKPETMALNWSCCRRGSGKDRGIQMYLDADSLKINRSKGGCESPVSIFIPKSPESRPRSPYECKRHCIGTQYAALLREEACRARERRLEKSCERMNCKPRWARG